MSLFRYLHISLCLNVPPSRELKLPEYWEWLKIEWRAKILASPRSNCAGGGENPGIWGCCGGCGWQRGFRKRIYMEYWGERSLISVSSWVNLGKSSEKDLIPLFSFIPLKINSVLFPKRLLYFYFHPPLLILVFKAKPGAYPLMLMQFPLCWQLPARISGEIIFFWSSEHFWCGGGFHGQWSRCKRWKVWVLLKTRAVFQPPEPWCCPALSEVAVLVSNTFCSPKYFWVKN